MGEKITMKQLTQLRDIKAEISTLEKRMAEYERALKRLQKPVADVVTGSRTYAPYDKHTIVVAGVRVLARDKKEYYEKRAELAAVRQLLGQKRDEAFFTLCRLERFILDIEDSHTRRMVELYCREGYSWQQVANRLGTNTADSCRKACERYIKNAGERVQ